MEADLPASLCGGVWIYRMVTWQGGPYIAWQKEREREYLIKTINKQVGDMIKE